MAPTWAVPGLFITFEQFQVGQGLSISYCFPFGNKFRPIQLNHLQGWKRSETDKKDTGNCGFSNSFFIPWKKSFTFTKKDLRSFQQTCLKTSSCKNAYRVFQPKIRLPEISSSEISLSEISSQEISSSEISSSEISSSEISSSEISSSEISSFEISSSVITFYKTSHFL